MKNIKKMLECRALFLQSIAYLNGENIDIDENFNIILESFLENYFYGNEDYFNLIYYFDIDEEGNLTIREEEEWTQELNKYLNYFRTNNNEKVIAMYNDIGIDDINRISNLASYFINYIMTLNDMNKARIKN